MIPLDVRGTCTAAALYPLSPLPLLPDIMGGKFQLYTATECPTRTRVVLFLGKLRRDTNENSQTTRWGD